MRIVRYKSIPWPNAMTIEHNPMTVFLLRDLKIEIWKGDTIEEVANAVTKYWRYSKEDARQIAALWFAMGERKSRQTTGGWEPTEISTDPARKYNPALRDVRHVEITERHKKKKKVKF